MTPATRTRAIRSGVLAGVIALAVVVSLPEAGSKRPEYPLDPGGTHGRGSRALVDAAQRLGWSPRLGALSAPGPFDTAATYLVLGYANGEALSPVEVGRLLAAVRRGAGLLTSAPPGSALADSLGLKFVRIPTLALDNTATLRALGATGPLPARGCEVEPVQQRRGSQFVNSVYDDSAAASRGPVLMTAQLSERSYPVVRGV